MGYFSEYLSKNMSFEMLQAERRQQLAKISEVRHRPVIAYASDLEKNDHIKQGDKIPFAEILQTVQGDEIDIILQTNGGDAAVVEDWVKSIRRHFKDVGVIIPHSAMSAGTIFAMAADEILMGPDSVLGPIDGQVKLRGNVISAGAVIKGLEDIVANLGKNKQLDIALLATLQSLSPGEITHCVNAQNFSKNLVSKWLEEYKFSRWITHRSDGRPVTDEERKKKAMDVASQLCDHAHWLTHSRSLHIEDLRNIGLRIEDYSKNGELNESIQRYNALLAISFISPVLKIFESVNANITLHAGPIPPGVTQPSSKMGIPVSQPTSVPNMQCEKCHNLFPIPVEQIMLAISKKDLRARNADQIVIKCPFCNSENHIKVNNENSRR